MNRFLKNRLILTSAALLCFLAPNAQTVGVVLSGGGATALAHVGFLKSLEENNIPIDYIGGTSMGAVIGAMYAAGYSVQEIDSITQSKDFEQMASGTLDDHLKFYFKESAPDASMATIKYNEGAFLSSALPSSLINPVLLDWNFMLGFSQADAAAGYNFDSLFVPFRCLAADIYKKKQIIFRDGHLNVATRASSTFPFYLPPRRVNGALLFDGGIYNNFPADVVYNEFMPDVIIGCNVSENSDPPDEDDLFSQIENMIQYTTNFEPICDYMIIVEPSLDEVGTFEWDKVNISKIRGYDATNDSMPEILKSIERRVSSEERSLKRQLFRKKFKPLIIDEVEISGLENTQKNYVRQIVGRNYEPVPLSQIKSSYFRIFGDDKIKSIFPVLTFNKFTNHFKLDLDVEKERDLFVSFGGNFASRSINTGYIGLRYNLFGRTSATLSANSYFGRFYGSVNAAIRWDVASSVPFSVQGGFTLNRWDYYKSLATFFEDVKPSFIVQNERTGGIAFNFAAGNKGTFKLESHYSLWFDEYYQTQEFLSTDTADHTEFINAVGKLSWERNTLNRKQFATKGTFLLLSGKYTYGEEWSIPGTTSEIRDTVRADHQWFTFRLKYTNYFKQIGNFTIGLNLEALASNQPLFNNFISTIIASPSFKPIPESNTFFLSQFRAHNYGAGGLIASYSLSKNFDLRVEGHVFSPFGKITPNTFVQAEYDYSFSPRIMASSALIFHSPLGPVSLSANYYELKDDPWSILFNFGYLLFNPSSRE
jgi:NTE family protein